MLNFVQVGSILLELRLFLYADIVKDVCEKRQFLCERQCFRITPCHVTFKILNLQVLHVYECGREREGVHPISFALFMTPEWQKGPLDRMISLEDAEGRVLCFITYV